MKPAAATASSFSGVLRETFLVVGSAEAEVSLDRVLVDGFSEKAFDFVGPSLIRAFVAAELKLSLDRVRADGFSVRAFDSIASAFFSAEIFGDFRPSA